MVGKDDLWGGEREGRKVDHSLISTKGAKKEEKGLEKYGPIL